mgnify:CR=1 FL=1
MSDSYKRPFDLFVLTLTHILLSPILLLLWVTIPLAIWLEDKGPVFYTQKRVGKHGKVFTLYKFRSMVVDAENLTGAVWAAKNDARITKVGFFLRKRALDELPQTINLWLGDLSLVGPRPERPELMDQITKELPEYAERLTLKPGLTGVAQVFGRYSSKPIVKLRYDRIYGSHLGLVFDTKLLFLSFVYTLKAKWQDSVR